MLPLPQQHVTPYLFDCPSLILVGDFVIFHQPISRGIVASVVLMVISSIVAGTISKRPR
jgi:hypothetical protein